MDTFQWLWEIVIEISTFHSNCFSRIALRKIASKFCILGQKKSNLLSGNQPGEKFFIPYQPA